MPTPSKKTQGPAKGASGVKSKNISTTKNDNTVQNNTSVGGDQDFLYIGKSFMQKEVEWLEKFHKLLKKKEKVDDSNKFSQNLQRLYDALLKELSTRCGETYESVFNAADDDQSETEMALNVTPRVNTKEKDLKDELAESSRKQQKLNEENNKLKDQLTSYQDKLKKFDDYKKEVDVKTEENNKLKQNMSEMKKRISEIENQQKFTIHPEKTDDALNILRDDSLNLQKKLSSQQQDLQQMQQKIDELTKKKANEKADFLKQKENPEKGKKFAALGPDQKLKELQEENEKLRDRLSKVTIADLGDSNRPTRLGDKFAELFENEWIDAMEELDNAGDEKSNINTLKNIVEKSYEFGKTRAANYVKGLEKALLDVSNSIEITNTISKYIKDQRKSTSLLVLDGLYKSFVSAHSEYNVGGDGVKNFIKKAVSLCWLMAIQDPPVVLTTKLTGKFDTDRFHHYTKSGSTVDYVVWPVLFLHEGGPIICRGFAQGK